MMKGRRLQADRSFSFFFSSFAVRNIFGKCFGVFFSRREFLRCVSSDSRMALSSRRPSFTTYQELSEYRNLFSCLICLELFTNPRILDCNHIFCEHCLQSYYALFRSSDPQFQNCALPCPTCRKLTPISVGGPAPVDIPECKVPEAARRRRISRCSDVLLRCDVCLFQCKQEMADFYCSKCTMHLCKSCRILHDQHPLFKGHFTIHVSNKESLDLYCETHSKTTCNYFCVDCNQAACVVCVLNDHTTHETSKLRDALAKRRDNLKTLLNQFGPKLDKLESAIKSLQALSASDSVASLLSNGDSRGSRAAEAAAAAGSAADTVRSSRCCVSHLSRPSTSDETSSSREGSAVTLNRSENESSSALQNDSDKTSVGSFPIQQSSSKSWCRVQSINQQSTSPTERSNASHSSGLWRRDGRFQAIVMQVIKHRKLFNLSTKILEMSQSKKLFAIYEDVVDRIKTVLEMESQQLIDQLDERIRQEETAERRMVAFEGGGGGAWTALRRKKSARLLLGVDPHSMSILVRPKLLWKTEKQRSDVGEMCNPCDVTFLSDDRIVVAEYDGVSERNNRLQMYDSTGRSLACLAQGQVRPLGVAVTREGNIAVTDCKGKRVKILTETGVAVAELGKGQFGWPYGIAVNSRGQVIVSDVFNDTVSVYQSDGKRIRMFGSTGSQHSHFRNPYHVTVDARDNIIVSDSGNNAIKVFDPSGKFLFYATDATRRPSVDPPTDRKVRRRALKGPRGIAVDPSGNVLVADDCCRVCMFDSFGGFVRNLLTEDDSVKYPEAVGCSSRGLLAVTEWNPNNMFAIKVFSMYE